jgi:hypothetical protein
VLYTPRLARVRRRIVCSLTLFALLLSFSSAVLAEVNPTRYAVLLDTSGSMEGKCKRSCMECKTPADCVERSQGVDWECRRGRCEVAEGAKLPCIGIWSEVRKLVATQLLSTSMIPDGGTLEVYTFSKDGKKVSRRKRESMNSASRDEIAEWLGRPPAEKGIEANASCTFLNDIMFSFLSELERSAGDYSTTIVTVLTDGFDEGSRVSDEELCSLVGRLRESGFAVNFWQVTEFSYLPDCLCPPDSSYCQCHTDTDGIPDDKDNCPGIENPLQVDSDNDTPESHECFKELNCTGDPTGCGGDVCDLDDDNDGDPDTSDCKPLDGFTYHGAKELCDGVDNNCDGIIDEGFGRTAENDDPCNYCPTSDCDGDKILNSEDNCWRTRNPLQKDLDRDCPAKPFAKDPLCGDECDGDIDGDGVTQGLGIPSGSGGSLPCVEGQSAGCTDNCPLVPNPSQVDVDIDGFGDACDCSYQLSVLPLPLEDPFTICRNLVEERVTLEWRQSGPAKRCASSYPLIQVTSEQASSVALANNALWSPETQSSPLRWKLLNYPVPRPAQLATEFTLRFVSGTDPVDITMGTDGGGSETAVSKRLFSGSGSIVAPTNLDTASQQMELLLDDQPVCSGSGGCSAQIGSIVEEASQNGLTCMFKHLGSDLNPVALSVWEVADDSISQTPAVVSEFAVATSVSHEKLRESVLEISLHWQVLKDSLPKKTIWMTSLELQDESGWVELGQPSVVVKVVQSELSDGGGSMVMWIVLGLLLLFAIGGYIVWSIVTYPKVSRLFVRMEVGDEVQKASLFRRSRSRFKAPVEMVEVADFFPAMAGSLVYSLSKKGEILLTLKDTSKDAVDRVVGRVSRGGALVTSARFEISDDFSCKVGQYRSRLRRSQ